MITRKRWLPFELVAILLCFVLGASCMRRRLAISYDGVGFYEVDFDSYNKALTSEQGLKTIFVSIDGGPGKRLSELTWDDFDPLGKVPFRQGNADIGSIYCDGMSAGFTNGKLGSAQLGASSHLRYGTSASGPFLSLPATRKQIEGVFGKPISVHASSLRAP